MHPRPGWGQLRSVGVRTSPWVVRSDDRDAKAECSAEKKEVECAGLRVDCPNASQLLQCEQRSHWWHKADRGTASCVTRMAPHGVRPDVDTLEQPFVRPLRLAKGSATKEYLKVGPRVLGNLESLMPWPSQTSKIDQETYPFPFPSALHHEDSPSQGQLRVHCQLGLHPFTMRQIPNACITQPSSQDRDRCPPHSRVGYRVRCHWCRHVGRLGGCAASSCQGQLGRSVLHPSCPPHPSFGSPQPL